MTDINELERQLQRLELVLKGTGLGLWDWNPQTGAVTFDERWCQMLGYELDEIVPNVESWSSRVHPDDIDQCFADITAHIEGRTEFYTNTHRMKHKNGSWRYILDRGQVMERDEDGQPIRFTGSHEDVTEKVTAHQTLEWKERVLNATQRVANIGSFNTDIRNDKQWYSAQLRVIFGYTPTEHFDRDLWIKHVHPEDVDEVVHATTEIFVRKEAKTSHLTYRIFTRQGEMRWIEVTWTYDFDDQGEISFIEGSVQDITQKYEAQAQQLAFERNQTDRFRKLSDTLMSVERVANIGSWSLDLKTSALVWSDETCRIHEVAEGYTPKVEKAIDFYEAGESREQIIKAIDHALTTGEGWDLELALRTAKGNRVWVRARGETEFEDGKCIRLFGVFQDISQRHYQEQALREANAKAERASEMKSEFLANMSHEIRTPMNAVLGLAQVLTRQGRFEPQVVEHAKKIVRAGQSLQNLLNDILDFSKIESGKLTLCMMPMKLSEMQENLALLMGNSARDKQIELIVDPIDQPHLAVIADQLRLEQILINLIGNAIKFTDSGYVACRIAIEENEQDSACVRLSFQVTDTGIGISQTQMQRILEPFAQADSSITRRFGGTGLGLAIAQRLLGLMDSKLEIQSAPGEGTVASFSLLLERAETTETELDQAVTDLDVLVVDDHDMARDAICRTVQTIGWKPVAATGGMSALARYKESIDAGGDIDLILMDWMMPDLDGASAAMQIKEYAATVGAARVPVIIMVTAFSQEQVEQSPHFESIDRILNKPVTVSSLRNVYSTLRDSRARSVERSLDAGNIFDGKTLLIVDDNLFNRDVAKIIFEGEGAQIALAEDGQQAIDWLQAPQNHADAVLMDVQMPVLDGLEATVMIRKQDRFASLPIIGMSAGAYQADIDMAMLAGMNAYITKPIDVQAAVQTVAEEIGIKLSEYDQDVQLLDGDQTVSEANSKKQPGVMELFDVSAAVKFWGSETTLVGYLERFIVDFNAALDQLNPGEVSAAELHKLKGSAGTIYLNQLASAISTVENDIKAGAEPSKSASGLMSIWHQTEFVITQFIELHRSQLDVSEPKPDRADSEIPASSLVKLREALDTFDPDEVEAILRPLMELYPSALLREIERLVRDFNFADASAQLEVFITQ